MTSRIRRAPMFVVSATAILVLFSVALAESAAKIPEIADYTSWDTVFGPFTVKPYMAGLCIHLPFVGHPGLDSSGAMARESRYVRVYANDVAAPMLEAGESEPMPPGPFPIGSVIVKEKLRSKEDPSPESLGIMIKREPGFDAENSDWEFLFQVSDGRLARGASELSNCTSCHRSKSFAGVRSVDFVFVDRYRREPWPTSPDR